MAVTLSALTELDWIDSSTGISYHLYLGRDDGLGSFEVLIGSATETPSQTLLKDLHQSRLNKRNVDLIVGIEFGSSIWLYGPEKDRAAVTLKADKAVRALQTCLDEEGTLSAYKRYVAILDAHSTTDMPGVRNRGLFANHHIRENVPNRKDWGALTEQARPLARLRHRQLVSALGFAVSEETSDALVLCNSDDENRAVAILLDGDETFENSSSRFPSSPVAAGLRVAQRLGVPWLIVIRKEQIRLYPGRDGVGVGQKGQVETYFELDLAMLDENRLGLLALVFSAESLSAGGATEILLQESTQYAAGLGERLRSRVYEKVVPSISTAIAEQLMEQGVQMDGAGLQQAYSITLKILFRLLFQAYAEDRGLLPAGRNERYDANSLKTIAQRDKDTPVEMFSNAATIWNDLVQVWDAIDQGSPLWQVPAYNGGLFGSDPDVHPEGHLIRSLRLPDSVLGPALQGLLIDLTDEGVQGPVDFRSLSVREFGTIYEGLLESSLSMAAVDMTVDGAGSWVPAGPNDLVDVPSGRPYFHSASGERKATGSYFTPKFVVDHLVERAIDPVITEHLDRIREYMRQGDASSASNLFFDFRVADLAMGSGHFLVAAVDRIEAHMRAFLADPETNVPGVIDELSRLRASAKDALGRDEAAIEEIEDASLLRRQIARRCIYGLDINPLAVELGRLALWIHTFVPGLPMSSLDHGLVCASSLTGIGTVEEALAALQLGREESDVGLFDNVIEDGLKRAEILLLDAASASEANKAEVANARELAVKAREEAKTSKAIFDVAVAARMKKVDAQSAFTEEDLVSLAELPDTLELTERVNGAHMPYLYPEVFLRDNPGFDVLLGNPPWEKLHVDEQRWWGIHIPGLRSLRPAEKRASLSAFQSQRPDLVAEFEKTLDSTRQMNAVISSGPYPGIGAAHLDLFAVFAWRNFQLLRRGGRAGVVLPRNALVGASLTEWRRTLLKEGTFEDITVLSNSRNWVFEAVHPQYTVALTVIAKAPGGGVRLSGPHYSMESFRLEPREQAHMKGGDVEQWSDNLLIPLVQDSGDVAILNRMFSGGKLARPLEGEFDFRPYAELNATSDKGLFQFEKPDTDDYVRVIGGSSFNLWNPDANEPYAYGVNPKFRLEMQRRLEKSLDRAAQAEKRQSGSGKERSAYFATEFNSSLLPMDRARIAYRQITNQTNTRTTIACLLPPNTAAVHSAPTLVRRLGNAKDEAFLLGVLSSIPFDWAARKWVEINLTMEIIVQLPVPTTQHASLVGREIADRAARLAAVDDRYEEWAKEVGVPFGSVITEADKANTIAELDALVSIAYGLDSAQIVRIFETFHRGWDYSERLEKVLAYFEEWNDRVR